MVLLMKRFPLFVTLDQLPVLVVGGGEIAERKIKLILKANANIHVLAKEFSQPVDELIRIHKLKKIQSELNIANLSKSYSLIIAATNSTKTNKDLYRYAQKHHILINVVDEPALCTCTFGSIVERGDLVVAISSGGNAPVFARQLREKIESILPQSTKFLIEFSGSMREKVANTFKQFNKRRVLWETFYEHLSTYKNLDFNQQKSFLRNFLTNIKSCKQVRFF